MSVSDRVVSKLPAFVLVLVCVSALSASDNDDKSDVRGSWLALSATRNGQSADDSVGHRLVFYKKKFEIRAKCGEVLFNGTYAVNRDKSPPRIDFKHSGETLKGTIWKGIYERKGNRLRICDNAPDTKKSRPDKFAAPRGSGYILIMFERTKK